MKSNKRLEFNTKQLRKGKEASLGKVKKEQLKSELKSSKTESKKSLVSSKANNAKQITIHLFSSTMKNNYSSSKSTPIMSFKVGEERRVSGGDKDENKFNSNPEKEDALIPQESKEIYSSSVMKGDKMDKAAAQPIGSKIKVTKKPNLFRKSITSKEDIYNYNCNSNNNYNNYNSTQNKNSFTPDSKKSILMGKKKSAFETKPKSGSNFPFIETINSPNNNKSPQHLISSNYVLSTNYTEANNNQATSPGISPSHQKVTNNQQSTNTVTHNLIKINPSNNQKNKIQSSSHQHNHHNIVNTIQTLGTILKSHTNNLEELKRNPQEMKKLNDLNQKLSQFENKSNSGGSAENKPHINFNDSYLKCHLNDSRNLMMENNVIRRETFIDNNYNKKTQTSEKEVIMNEIYNNSNNRIKKYGILFDFINNNIKEITEMMSQNNTMNKQVEEENLNGNVIFNKEIEKVLNEEKLLKDISNSFINSSSSDIDFYRNLIDQTFNRKIGDISDEMSTMQMQSKIDLSTNTNDRLDKTQNQFDSDTLRSRQLTPNGMEENDTKVINEGSNVKDNKNKLRINPHILLQNLKDKQLEKKGKAGASPNKNVNKHIHTLVKADKEVESKCIIF